MSPAKIPDSKVKQIIDDCALGTKLIVVAAEHGVSKTFVSKIAIRHGLRRQKFELTEEKLQAILADYKSGVLLKQIEFKYRISARHVRILALRHGMRLRQPRKSWSFSRLVESANGRTVRKIGI